MKRCITAVFELPEGDVERLPMYTETQWGTVIGLSVGDLMYTDNINKEALDKIYDCGCDSCSSIAEKAAEVEKAYLLSQLAGKK